MLADSTHTATVCQQKRDVLVSVPGRLEPGSMQVIGPRATTTPYHSIYCITAMDNADISPQRAGTKIFLGLGGGGRPGCPADEIVHRRYPAIHAQPGQSYPQSVDGYVE
jgi:hypothetical protein